uniref:Uncharacterized protein n=1 Tax=Lepeophtheirus salmonis TaxID=72036 RepID=A0A0K2VFR3_LEPSM
MSRALNVYPHTPFQALSQSEGVNLIGANLNLLGRCRFEGSSVWLLSLSVLSH